MPKSYSGKECGPQKLDNEHQLHREQGLCFAQSIAYLTVAVNSNPTRTVCVRNKIFHSTSIQVSRCDHTHVLPVNRFGSVIRPENFPETWIEFIVKNYGSKFYEKPLPLNQKTFRQRWPTLLALQYVLWQSSNCTGLPCPCMGKLRPAGHIRPVTLFNPTRWTCPNYINEARSFGTSRLL